MHNLSYKSLLTIVVILLIGIVFLLRIRQKPTDVFADWFNDAWMYRQAINVSSHSVGETNVYIIASVNIGTTTKANTNDGDFRFTDINGKLLTYYIASGVGTTNITFHIYLTSFPAGAQTVYAYYGNPSAANGFALADFATQASSYALGAAAAEEVGGGPIAWWKFDEGVGTSVFDASSNKNNGVFGGGNTSPAWITDDQCISGKCLRFDGAQNISGSLSNNINSSSFTISAWINPTLLSGSKIFFALGNSYATNSSLHLRLNADGSLLFGFYSNDLSSSAGAVVVNKWQYVTYTYDSTSGARYIYVNGVQVGYGVSASPFIGNSRFSIGSWYNTQQYFNGFIDNLTIYKYVRTTAQLKAAYDLGLAGQSASHSSTEFGSAGSKSLSDGLVGYWKFDEGVGTTGADSSGNGIINTFSGTTLPTWSNGKFGIGASLDGITSFISVGTLPTLTSWTFSSWGKANSLSNSRNTIFGFNTYGKMNFKVQTGDIEITADGNGYLETGAAAYATSLNTWYLYTITCDSTVNKIGIYINGFRIYYGMQGGYTCAGTVNTNTLYIGAGQTSNQKYGGTVDEFRVYNRALSPTEVKALYNFAPGPVGYWRFDEGVGTTAYDSSGNSNNGGLINSPSWVSGKFGKSLLFNGSSSYINSPTSSLLDPGFANWTVSLYAKSSSVSSLQALVDKYNSGGSEPGYVISVKSNGALKVRFGDGVAGRGEFDGSTNIVDGTWKHIEVVFDKTKALPSIYINGIPDTVTELSGWINTYGSVSNSSQFQIGYFSINPGYAGTYFNGLIDDVKIYNYARTQEQILQDMTGDSVSAPHLGVPIAWYKFDEGAGSVANNSGVGGTILNGTLGSGSSAPTWVNGKINKALSFNGITYTFTSVGTTINTVGSVAFWINRRTNGAIGYVTDFRGIGSSGGGWIYLNTNNTFSTSGGSIYVDGVASTAVPLNSWHRVVVSGIGLTINQDFTLGIRYDRSNFGLDGIIDDFKVYNYALSSDEVKSDYNQGASVVFGQSNQTIGATTTSLDYCVPGSTDYCATPIAQWNFEEGTGTTAYDTSGNGYNGGLIGTTTPTWISGKIGKALNFNGSTSYVDAGDINATEGISALTVSYWVNGSAAVQNAFSGIVSKGVDTGLSSSWYSWTTPSNIYWQVSNGSSAPNITVSSGTVLNNKWHFFTGTYDGSKISFYLDTILQGTAPLTGNINSTTIPVQIGRYNSAGRFFNGSIDQVRIYNYARTPAQIAYDYNRGSPIGWWKFDDCQGNVANDSSGIGNTGTITIGVGGSQVSLGTCNIGDTSAWSNGKSGKINASLSLDGTDDWVSLGNSANFNTPNDYSLAMWVYNKSGGKPYPTLLNRNNQGGASGFFWIYTTGTNNRDLNFQYANGSTYVAETFSSAIPLNTWVHVLFTFNSTTNALQLFINGTKFSTTHTLTTPLPVITGNLYFGTYQNSSASYPFYGQFDDFRLYNYALTTSQIKTLYNNGAVNFK